MKRVLGSTNGDGEKWWQKYYDVVSHQELAKRTGCTLEDIANSSATNVPHYDFIHLAWLYAKPEYEEALDAYFTAELVEESGNVFVAIVSGGRVVDIKYEVLDMLRASYAVESRS